MSETTVNWRRPELFGLMVLTVVIYGANLGGTSREPGAIETALIAPARAIAATGRDADGRRLPLFLHAADDVWQQPIPGYAVTLSQRVVGESIVAARAMSVAVATINIALLYLVARRLFPTGYVPLLCAAMLLAAPLHLVEGRSAREAIYVLPFVLIWLLRTLTALRSPGSVSLLGTGVWLGVGVFSAAVAPLQMFLLLLLSIALHIKESTAWRADAGFLLLGFGAPLLVPVMWFALHPDAYGDTWGRWVIFKAHLRSPIEGVLATLNWNTLATRGTTYWSLLNPATLFLPPETGRGDYADKAAVFLSSVGVLLLIGIRQVVQGNRATMLTLFGGLLVAPIAAATFGESNTLSRALTITPFVVLIAAFGLQRLLASSATVARVGVFVLLVLTALQFGRFFSDYLAADPGVATLTIAPHAVSR